MKYKLHDTERVNHGTMRMVVPGGWVYSTWTNHESGGVSEAACFVPDQNVEIEDE